MDLSAPSTSTATADVVTVTSFNSLIPSKCGEELTITEEKNLGSSVKPNSNSEVNNLSNMGIPNNWPDDSLSSPHHSVLDYLPSLPAPPGFEEMPLLESQEESVHYPSPSHSTLFTSESEIVMDKDITDPKAVSGICGLRNLGNTCFMNAGLQCLLNNRNFVRFFLEQYESDENTKDLLTSKFAQLAVKVWSGQYSVLHLSDFKDVLGKYHPQFKDFRQHDCQEFLTLLLDSMHEQLNTACNQSSHSTASLDGHSQCAAFLVDKTAGIFSEENRSDLVEDEEHVIDDELGVCDSQTEHPEHQDHPQPHSISDNSSHSASPHSTDSFNSWDMNSVFRLYPVPEDVKPFGDVPSVSTKDVDCKDCLLGDSKSNYAKKIPLENNVFATRQGNNSHCIAENIIPLDSLTKGISLNPVKCSQRLPPINVKCKKLFEKNELASQLNSSCKIPTIEDFVKETKTLNTNVLVSEVANNQIKFDSEKFPKHEHLRLRETVDNLSELKELETKHLAQKRVKETNIMQEQKELGKDLSDDLLEEVRGSSKRMRMAENWSVEKNVNDAGSDQDIMESEPTPLDDSESSHSEEMKDIVSGYQVPSSMEETCEADNEWEKYQSKNQSIVVDSYQGQFQSTVVCSECGHISVTYEPFMYLPVPLPHALERQIAISYIPTGKQPPSRYLVTVHNYDKAYKLKEALLSLIGEDCPREVILAEVFDNHISRLLDDNVLVKYVNDTTRTIYAFALSSPPLCISKSGVSSEKGRCRELKNDPGGGDECQLLKMSENSNSSHDTNLFDEQKMAGPSDNFGTECYKKNAPHSVYSVGTINCSDSRTLCITNCVQNDSVSSSTNNDRLNEQDTLMCNHTKLESREKSSDWQSCAICLEDMPNSSLLIHPPCQCVLCHSCIEISCKHYGGDSLICPVCSIPIKPDEFVCINKIDDYKAKISLLSIPIVFRLDTLDGTSLKNKTLLGHPGLLKLPTSLPATVLYECVDKSVPFLSTYTLLFVDGQGRNCSRCLYTQHCSGCEVARVGDISLLPGDSLAVRFTHTGLENIENAVSVIDHESMECKRHQEILTLYDCLEAFSESETLDEHNPWYCPVCMRNQRARKSLSVWRCPDTLMIYLKRFVFHEYSTTKIDDKVLFPIEGLDLSSYISGPCSGGLIYNLQACVCHFGGVHSGHYTSYAKHAASDEWYYFNDEIVTKQISKEADHSHAYILFYQRPNNTELPFCKKGTLLCDKPVISPDEGSSSSVGLKPDTITHILQQLEDSEEFDKRNINKDDK